MQLDTKWKRQLNGLHNQWVEALQMFLQGLFIFHWEFISGWTWRYLSGAHSVSPHIYTVRGVCGIPLSETSLCLHLIRLYHNFLCTRRQFALLTSQIHTWIWVLVIFQFAWQCQSGQAVGLTAWEAAANLSLRVYLLYATIHELRHQGRGRCVLRWVVVDGGSMELPLMKNSTKSQDAFQEDDCWLKYQSCSFSIGQTN